MPHVKADNISTNYIDQITSYASVCDLGRPIALLSLYGLLPLNNNRPRNIDFSECGGHKIVHTIQLIQN